MDHWRVEIAIYNAPAEFSSDKIDLTPGIIRTNIHNAICRDIINVENKHDKSIVRTISNLKRSIIEPVFVGLKSANGVMETKLNKSKKFNCHLQDSKPV